MKTGADKGKLTPLDFDLRVRDRRLGNGVLDHKDIERYLVELPDLEGQTETMSIDQPALGGSSAESGRNG